MDYAIITFNNDPSVGWMPEHYEMQIPPLSEIEDREFFRNKIQVMYFVMNNEQMQCNVTFSDEIKHDF